MEIVKEMSKLQKRLQKADALIRTGHELNSYRDYFAAQAEFARGLSYLRAETKAYKDSIKAGIPVIICPVQHACEKYVCPSWCTTNIEPLATKYGRLHFRCEHCKSNGNPVELTCEAIGNEKKLR